MGDIVIMLMSKKGDPHDPAAHEAYEVLNRYLVPDKVGGFPRLKLLVKRRSLTAAEASMFPSD